VLDIPPAAGWLLDAVGLKYQLLFVDADEIRAFAETVRQFARRVGETNDQGTQVVNTLGASWEGASYSALVSAWAHKNNANMAELLEASEFVATALDAAATTVQIVQAAVLAELAALGAAFIGAQFAAAGTMGASLAVSVAVRAAAHRLVSAMQEVLVSYLIEQVLEAAIKPLEEVVERIINGYGRPALADYLGVSNVFRMDPPELERAANTFDDLAEQMTDHGRWLADQLAKLFQDDGVADFGDDSYRFGEDPYRGIDMPYRDAGLPEIGDTAAPPGGPVPDPTTDSSVVPVGPDVGAVAGRGGVDDLNGSDPYLPAPPPMPIAGPVAPNPNAAPVDASLPSTAPPSSADPALGSSGPVAPNSNIAPVGAGQPSAAPPSNVGHELGGDRPDERDIHEGPRMLAGATSSLPPSTDVPWRTESVAPEASSPGVAASAAPNLSDTPPPAEAAPVPWAAARQDALSRADENRPAPWWASRPPGRPGKARKSRRARSQSEQHVLVGQQDSATADSGQVIPTPWEVTAKAASVAKGSDAEREAAPPVRAVAPSPRTDGPKRTGEPKRTDASKVEVVAPEVTPPPRQ
jgi:uncharacterized protein YukE